MKLVAYLIYVPLQIIWLPLSLLGALVVAYKQLVVSKRLGVSQTAVEIIKGRWTMDVIGLRRDDASRKLAARIPNHSTLGLRLALFRLWLARQIAGTPIIYPTVPAPEMGADLTRAQHDGHRPARHRLRHPPPCEHLDTRSQGHRLRVAASETPIFTLAIDASSDRPGT